jgi:hypothetical protein
MISLLALGAREEETFATVGEGGFHEMAMEAGRGSFI